jgi:hypothetical protein
MAKTKTRDNHPAIMIKPGILARSGVYLYSYDEMVKRGFTPPVKKEFYKEYRPAHVLVRNKDKFAFSTMTVEHTPDETSPDNFRDQTSGIVGDSIEVVALENGEVALQGRMAFYTQDAVDYYNAGNKETSADYRSKVVLSKNPEYDLELVDIISVNGVVITERGRGGPSVRVMDSAPAKNQTGGLKMKKGVLSTLFGIGRSKDGDSFKLSALLMEKVKAVHTMDAAGVTKAVEDVMAHITTLGDREEREILIGAVTDSFKHPVEVATKEKEVSEMVDKLYTRCRDADAEELKKTMDASETDEEAAERKEKEAKEKLIEAEKLEKGKGDKTQDTAKIVEEAVAKALAPVTEELKRVKDSIPAAIDAGVAKALGIAGEKPGEKKKGDDRKLDDNRVADSASYGNVDDEAAFLLNGVFGQ